MADAIEIRRAYAAEREQLLALWLALVEHHRRLDPGYPVPASLASGLRAEIERGLGAPGCAIWLALESGRAIGFAFAEAKADSRAGDDEAVAGWIHEIWVEPSGRRRGVATALAEQARAFLRARGSRIAVRVEAANAAALAFWSALGFHPRAHVLERIESGPA
jgi:GNAT superfamily N-acetyltransferase